MLTIFVSSTFRDLANHRQAVVHALSVAGHHPIVMEQFGSQSEDAATASEDEVRRADLFVGIYAHRYGYRPAEGKSVTEMEYDAARQAAIDCLVFLVEDGYREGDLGNYAEEDPISITMLDDFKNRLSTTHVRDTFTTPDSLAARVVASVAKWNDRHKPPNPLQSGITADRSMIGNPTITPLSLAEMVDADEIEPSNLPQLVEALQFSHLVILGAPRRWGLHDIARQLARHLLGAELGKKKDGSRAYGLTQASSASALLYAIENQDKQEDLKGCVIIADDVSAAIFRDKFAAIQRAAQSFSVYVILTTQEKPTEWDIHSNVGFSAFYWVPDSFPYDPDDLAKRLVNKLNQADVKNDLRAAGVLPESTNTIHHDTLLHGLEKPVAKLVEDLNTVHKIDTFVIKLHSITHFEEIRECLTAASNEGKPNIERWFDDLEPEDRYLVLALSLVNDLPQETFWAIYEYLTEQAWRLRFQQLSMSDYYDIQARLVDYIDAQGEQIRFHNAEDRASLVGYALNSYRRSLVQALPLLANIFTRTDQIVAMHNQTVTMLLRELAIFGSDHEYAVESYYRQNRLRNSLSMSIAQIALREVKTTENLLVAWAQTTPTADSDFTREGLRLAVSSVLLQMYQIERDDSKSDKRWSERYKVFNLLNRWYERYYVPYDRDLWAKWRLQGRLQANINRFANVRGAIAFTLCEMSMYMSNADFEGSIGREDVFKWLEAVPDEQPHPEALASPWDMLVALAWDPSADVRVAVFESLPTLAKKHPHHALRLFLLLTGDRDIMVLQRVAYYLVDLFYSDSRQLALIFSFLSDARQPEPHRENGKPAYLVYEAASAFAQMNTQNDSGVDRRYMSYERDLPRSVKKVDIFENNDFQPHQFAATFALFIIGELQLVAGETKDPEILSVFDLYLNAWLTNENTSQFKAFKRLLLWLEHSENRILFDYSGLAKHIESSKAADWNPQDDASNPPSPAALAVKAYLAAYKEAKS